MLQIVTNPNPILRQKAQEISLPEIKTPAMQKLVLDMVETMLIKDGIGLAAPQINKSIRLIIVNTQDGVLAIFNPVITKKSWTKETDEEGCLSIQGCHAIVKRAYGIEVKGYDRQGEEIKMKAKGLLARVLQHEIDHLDGILFIDKAKKVRYE